MSALEDLVVSSKEINRDLVAEVLSPFIRIDRDDCEIVPTSNWRLLSNDTKTLLYLTARKAMVALDMPLTQEAATPQEIERETGVIGNSLRPLLKRLLSQRLVTREHSRYLVPNHALSAVKNYISGKAKVLDGI